MLSNNKEFESCVVLFTQLGLETAEKEWFSEAKGWICSLARAGATIGDDEIVGAHALVTSDVPARSVAVGAPVRVINVRNL